MTPINSLADVRPGDICFTKISRPWLVMLLVRLGHLLLGRRVRLGRLSVDHVIVVTEAARDWIFTDSLDQGVLLSPVPGHVAPMLMMPPIGVQAMPRGAERVVLTEARHWGPEVAYCRLPEDWPGQMDDVAAIAKEMVRQQVAYSFASYLMLALYRWGVRSTRLEARINRRRPGALKLPSWSNGPEQGSGHTRGGRIPVEAICSVLADQCLTLAGKHVMDGVPEQVVTPGALALQLWWRTPDARWYGAGML